MPRGTAHLPVERRRQLTAKACRADPPLAQRSVTGGRRWANRYYGLPPEERARIIAKCVLGWYRWDARRRGLPDPVAYTFEPETDARGQVSV
jgi:hypothetical protein